MMEPKDKDTHDAAGAHDSTQKEQHKSHPVVLPYMQNREISWLAFNKRVLDQGEDHNQPLLERLTFVSIFSSNLQEFFMVRVGSLTDLALVNKKMRDSKTQMTPNEQLQAIYNRCHELYPEQERIFEKIQGQLAEHNICQLQPKDLNEEQAQYLHTYLERKVMPFLSPQIINSRHPFPHLENGALYVLLRLDEELNREKTKANEKNKAGDEGKNKKKVKNLGADDATFGLIPLPRQASRVIRLPGEGTQFILLEHALKTIVDEVFSMYTTKRASVICVTRNADIDPNDGTEEIDYDYREHMKRILKKRRRLAPVRLETDTPLSSVTEKFLLPRLGLKPCQVFVTKVPLDMGYAWGLPSMVDPDVAAKLTNQPFSPSWPACLDKSRPIIEQVCEKDVLLSYPYESMDPFISLLREAAHDPSVFSIKITLYRLASQSHLAEALLSAAENGKEVTALFELRARFDESNNIEWSQRFEQAGANVIYGFHDFKVHSKICTITRHTDHGIQYITQLGTGNYNEKTSKLYTDFSYITTDEGIGLDAAEFFRNMCLENASDNYRKLSVAPLQIKPMILRKIDEQIALAQEGKPNGLAFKTNSVTDKDIIDKIAEASQAGVHTTLFVRGISCIVPGIKGFTDNVEVVSIVGRLLEHSRIYAFGDHDNREIYLSSADLMTRNMDKRVEIAWPIPDGDLKQQVNEYFDICLADTAKLRRLKSDLSYTDLEYFAPTDAAGNLTSFDSQAFLIKKAQADYEASLAQREEERMVRSATARAQRVRDQEMSGNEAEVKVPKHAAPAKDSLQSEENLFESLVEAMETDTAKAAEAPTSDAEAPVSDQADAAVREETIADATDAARGGSESTAADAVDAVAADGGANTAADGGAVSAAGAEQAPVEQAAPAEKADVLPDGIVEVEPGVAGPESGTSAASSASASPTTTAQPAACKTVETEVLPPLEQAQSTAASSASAIQLVPKKASLWTRIKFLFTGKL